MHYIYIYLLSLVHRASSTHINNEEIPEEVCSETSSVEAPRRDIGGNPRCFFGFKAGRCRAAIPGVYFDWKTRKCEESIYGGCGGCKPFDSLEECEEDCKPFIAKPVQTTTPPKTFPPKENIPKEEPKKDVMNLTYKGNVTTEEPKKIPATSPKEGTATFNCTYQEIQTNPPPPSQYPITDEPRRVSTQPKVETKKSESIKVEYKPNVINDRSYPKKMKPIAWSKPKKTKVSSR